eukprot:2800642-Amphidinium_carterae.1
MKLERARVVHVAVSFSGSSERPFAIGARDSLSIHSLHVEHILGAFFGSDDYCSFSSSRAEG